MKKVAFIFLVLIAFSTGCRKNQDLVPEPGIITGPDYRICTACCGGWFIEIGDTTLRFYELPAGSDIDLGNSKFPLPVSVVWQRHNPQCLGDEIDILQIARR